MTKIEGRIISPLIWFARWPRVWKLLRADVVEDTRIGGQWTIRAIVERRLAWSFRRCLGL